MWPNLRKEKQNKASKTRKAEKVEKREQPERPTQCELAFIHLAEELIVVRYVALIRAVLVNMRLPHAVCLGCLRICHHRLELISLPAPSAR